MLHSTKALINAQTEAIIARRECRLSFACLLTQLFFRVRIVRLTIGTAARTTTSEAAAKEISDGLRWGFTSPGWRLPGLLSRGLACSFRNWRFRNVALVLHSAKLLKSDSRAKNLTFRNAFCAAASTCPPARNHIWCCLYSGRTSCAHEYSCLRSASLDRVVGQESRRFVIVQMASGSANLAMHK